MLKLFNGNVEAKINLKGAELSSLTICGEEKIWTADPKFWGRHAPVLFPIVGALKDNEYSYNGKIFKMNQHGFARDMEFKIMEQEDDMVLLQLNADHNTLSVYPFYFTLEIRYKLSEKGINVTYIVINDDDKTMLYSIGGHPGFNISNINNCEILINGDYDLLPLDGSFIGENIKRGNGNIKLSNESFVNDAIILKNQKEKKIILNEDGKESLEFIYDDFDVLGIWKPYNEAPFLCIEPWNGIADYNEKESKELKDKEEIRKLKVGAFEKFTYKINFNEEK